MIAIPKPHIPTPRYPLTTMLRQSKPLSTPDSPTSQQAFSRSQLLSLDWDGGADRYPNPGGVRRPPTPIDDLFLSAATRYPIERPTHETSSSETVSWYTDNHASSPSSPGDTLAASFTSAEGLAGFERRRAVRERSPLAMNENDQGYDESMVIPLYERVRNDNDNQEEVLYEQPPMQRREPTGCAAGQHTPDVKRSLRQKLGRTAHHATCSQCGDVFEVKHAEHRGGTRRTLSLGGHLRRSRVE